MQLINEKERHEFYDEIIEEIKKSHHETFDKLSVLLLMEERYEELIKEISKQQNKFWLLNEVAVKMLPYYNEMLFKVFVKQFHSSLNVASDTYYQKRIFNEARKYIDKLPGEQKEKLLKAIASGLGGKSYLRNLISETYSL